VKPWHVNLEPIEVRRLRYDLVQYYKILNSLTLINPADYENPRQLLLTYSFTNNLVVSSTDTLTAGTVCHPLCVTLNKCQLLNLL